MFTEQIEWAAPHSGKLWERLMATTKVRTRSGGGASSREVFSLAADGVEGGAQAGGVGFADGADGDHGGFRAEHGFTPARDEAGQEKRGGRPSSSSMKSKTVWT